MDLAAKRYARWVIVVHVVLLATVVWIVYAAAQRTYQAARGHAIQQAARVQMLLAEQTQRGIENYYSSIVDTIELLNWAEQSDTPGAAFTPLARNILGPSIWEQLKNRASHFAAVNRRTGNQGVAFPLEDAEMFRAFIVQNLPWVRSVDRRGISPVLRMGKQDVNIVCACGPRGVLAFVAVVPVANIEESYLQKLNAAEMSAMIFDQNMRVISAFDKELVGLSMLSEAVEGNDDIRKAAAQYVQMGTAGTEIVEKPFRLGSHEFARGMVSIRPMNVLGSRLWLTISSDLSQVESVLRSTFHESLLWGLFLIVSMTVILASTSAGLIRSRVGLERMRRETLTRELEQARKIQLAWLPRNDEDPPHVDLCAVNKPASHISGDFYNWFDLSDDRVCVVIGDVTGHGMAAAFLMATTQLLVKMAMPRAADAGKCLEAVNHQLCNQVFAGQFVTMQILVLDRKNRKLEAATAGHPPPLIRRQGKFEPLEVEPQLVLGVERGQTYTAAQFEMARDASILMYTDGVTEARSPDGDWLGIERLCESLSGQSITAENIARDVEGVVDQFRGKVELVDDLTLVAIHLE